MSRAARAALAAVPGAAVLWWAGHAWWSTGIAGAAFSRDVEVAAVVAADGLSYGAGGVFIETTSLILLIALVLLGVVVSSVGASLAARPSHRSRLVSASLGAVIVVAVLAHLAAPLEASWPPVAVAAVLVATGAVVARRAPLP